MRPESDGDDAWWGGMSSPRDLVELYPHPAFVIALPTAGQSELTTSHAADTRLPLGDVCWGNAAWRHAAGSRSLPDCLESGGAPTLAAWLAGRDARRPLSLAFAFGPQPQRYHLAQTSLPPSDRGGAYRSTYIVITTIPSEWTEPESSSPFPESRATRDAIPSPPSMETVQVSAPNTAVVPVSSQKKHRKPTYKPFDPPVRPPAGWAGEWPCSGSLAPSLAAASLLGDDLLIGPDGSIERYKSTVPAPGSSPSGRPYDVRKLLDDTIDWASTPLGPRTQWRRGLKGFSGAITQAPNMAVMWFGRQFTMMYNQYYANDMEPDHPDAFGTSGPESWARIWSLLGPLVELVLGGQALYLEDRLVIHPNKHDGKLRERYYQQTWLPLRETDESFLGIYFRCLETTTKVIAERRTTLLRRLAEYASIGRTMDDFDRGALKIIEDNPKDAPFAILYHVERPSAAAGNSSRPTTPRLDGVLDARVELKCAGSVGVPFQHKSRPDSLTLTLKGDKGLDDALAPPDMEDDSAVCLDYSDASPAGTPGRKCRTVSSVQEPLGNRWPFAEALNTHRPILVQDCSQLIQGYAVRVWDELPTSAVVIPITRDSDDGIPGAVLVLGISNRLPFDEAYEIFIDMLRIQMASFLVAVRSYLQDQELIQQLAAVDRAKNLLFSNVANDLLTPLSVLSGPLDDLVDDVAGNATASNLLNIARCSVRNLRANVRMLVEVSSLAHGPGVMAYSKVNLGALTRDMASMFRKAIEKKGVEYRIDCDVTPQEVYLDREAWEKIVVTTLGMSLRYTRNGFISVSVKYANRQAVVEFRNSSTGLPKRLVDRLGRLEYQTERDELPPGYIVHFALLKKLLDAHGGTLAVESSDITESDDSGVRVIMHLPLGFKHLPPEDVRLEADVAPNDLRLWEDWEDASLETPSTGDRRSWGVDPATLFFEKTDVILLVDENPDSLRYMRAIFESFCTVIEATSAKAALELCSSATPPDLVIADLTLPYQNGDFLLAKLRAGPRHMQLTPLIMLTPHEDSRPEHAIAADDYLARPFNARELLSRGHMQLQLGKRRRELEARFDERTAELRALTEESPMGIIRMAPAGNLTYANSAWYKQSGYPLDGDLTDWPNYLDESCREAIQANWVAFLKDTDRLTDTVTGRWANGIWMCVKTTKMYATPGGPLTGYLGSCMDVSEHKLNEQLQNERIVLAEQRRREAEEAKAQQELLIDITSHEIRNPISSLMQCSSLVKTNLLGLQEDLRAAVNSGAPYHPTPQLLHTIQEDLDALDSIYECALTQERISNDVLSLGKIQLDLLQMFDVATNIREEISKVVAVFQNEARMNRIQLSLRFAGGFDALGVSSVKIDPVRFCQIVTNLLANAIRFVTASEERRIDVRVDLGSVPPEEGTCTKPAEPTTPVTIGPETPLYLYTEVADTGPGLKPSEFETLFQRFTQASAKTHTVFGGSGLGLFVCRKIAERMGGRIEVASEYARGSVFRFFVETRACTNPPAAEPPSPRYAAASLAKEERVRRVLIVEDNVINRTVLQRQLKHVGFLPDSVGNGLEAVERLRSLGLDDDGYDCVLMDLEMPVMDGYTATRLLRQDEAAGLPANAIIALTGNARQAQLHDKMADFDDVVVKPYRLDDLLATIERAVRTRCRERGKAVGASGERPRSDDT